LKNVEANIRDEHVFCILSDNSVAAMLPIEKAFCSKTIRALLATKCAEPFRKPVDPDFYGISDYFDIVKNPMDLGTIKNKFEKGQYKAIAEFNGDINLMFYNCFLYNHETDPVCNDAKVLQGVFKKLLQRFNESVSFLFL
jgi:hypothetical protein